MPQVVVRMLSGSLVLRPQLLQLDNETEGMICSPALFKVKSSKNSAKESAAISETFLSDVLSNPFKLNQDGILLPNSRVLFRVLF